MTSSVRNARIIGGLLIVLSFGAGVAVGMVLPRREPPGPRLTMTATDDMPEEVARLDLTREQRATIQAALVRGRDRVIAIVDEFSPRVEAAVDSTDQEIRALLDSTQRASFDSARKVNGPLLKRRRIYTPREKSPPR